MKIFKKLSIIICLLIIVYSCSKNESVVELPKETVSLEDGLEINFDDLTVITLDGEADVDEDGDFNASTITTTSEDLPILFTKGEEIMFGYYSKTGSDNTVSIDDMLLFYFTAHPEVAIQSLSNSVLLNKIKSTANYAQLKILVTNSLKSNNSPYENTDFIQLLSDTGYSIAKDSRGYKQTKTKGGDVPFQYTFSRDGKVSWPKEFPLFASVGMEITDSEGAIYERYIFDKKGLVASPGSLIKWIHDYLTIMPSEQIVSYQFSKDAEYFIDFTNGEDGIVNQNFEEEIDTRNRLNLAVTIVSTAVPIGFKVFLEDKKCAASVTRLFIDIGTEPISVIANDKFELQNFIKGLHSRIYSAVKDCIPEAKLTYFDKIKALTSKINLAEDTAEAILFIRDYVASDISGSETRYFYNGISYGKLDLTNISGSNNGVPTSQTEFTGVTDSEHIFKGILSEEVFTYDITRNITSTIKQEKVPEKNVSNFPFIAETLSGDATQVTNSSITTTNTDGNLEMTFKMGTQNSQFEIKPSFVGKGFSDAEVIVFKPETFNYEGTWLMTVNNLDDSLHHYERVVFDKNGVSTYNETNIPDQNTGWYTTPYTYFIKYNDARGLLNITVGGTSLNFPFVVSSFDDTRFLGDGNYYSAGYGEYFKLILDRE